MAQKLGCSDRLHVLGYRDDVLSVMKSCDVFILPSKREGLSVALMEAMACGLPCCASNIRGNRDLLNKADGGLFSIEDIACRLVEYLNGIDDLSQFKGQNSKKNKEKISGFSSVIVQEKMREIYAG